MMREFHGGVVAGSGRQTENPSLGSPEGTILMVNEPGNPTIDA